MYVDEERKIIQKKIKYEYDNKGSMKKKHKIKPRKKNKTKHSE